MKNENARVPLLWENFLTTLWGHDPTSEPGIAHRHWVHFQGVHNILDLLNWDQEELKTTPDQQVYSLDDHGQGLYLKTNQVKQICGLITYMKHYLAPTTLALPLRMTHFITSHQMNGPSRPQHK